MAFQAKGVHYGLGSEAPEVAAASGEFSHQARGPRPHMGQEDGDEKHRPDCIPQQVRSPDEIDAELRFLRGIVTMVPMVNAHR